MNLYIKIMDEDGDTLRSVNVYIDGSDSEGADRVADLVLENYEGARNIEVTKVAN